MPAAAPVAPSQAQASWISGVIGGPPDLSVFVRPTAARGDTYWGPMLSRVLAGRDNESDFISHGSGLMVLNARQIDLHIAIRDPINYRNTKGDPRSIGWVGVIHGMVPTDPLGLRTGGGKPLFAPAYRLPSGVLMYPPDAAYAQQFGLFAPTLFVTPDGTCVVTEQVSAPHARDMLAQNGGPPPALQAAPESLGGVTASVTSLRFLNGGKDEKAAMIQGAIATGFGLRGGANGAIDGYADYATSDDAERAFAAFQRTCAERAEKCALEPGWFKDAKAERDDRRIVVTLLFSDAMLSSVRELTP
ncbi:MAG: hypothetical protein JWM74_3800 [Myxococcaceae bacterium]|nr:hypothetical protein [Myxococcaceae bacterium]